MSVTDAELHVASDDELSDDIRLLGRLLGDVIRRQAGTSTFELVEQVRRTAVDARRSHTTAVDDLEALLGDRPIGEQLHVIRAFDWLALLANTAEDVHLERRRRHHRVVGTPARAGSLVATFERIAAAGVPAELVDEVISELRVSPVITAHPTEVRRQTILRVVNEVADLLDERDRLDAGDPAVAEVDDRLTICIITLWQTALLRLSKLRVRDEINEALRYYDASLFETVPALTSELETMAFRQSGSQSGSPPVDATGAIRMGSWIGGDRDGNPFVTADVLALRRQPAGGDGARSPPALRRAPLGRAVDVGALDHAHRRAPRRWPGRRATTRRSGPTSPTGARCAACTPGCTRSPQVSSAAMSTRSTRLRPASRGSHTSRSTNSSTTSMS